MSPKTGPFQKEKLILQPSVLRGYLSFQGGLTKIVLFHPFSHLHLFVMMAQFHQIVTKLPGSQSHLHRPHHARLSSRNLTGSKRTGAASVWVSTWKFS